MSKKNNTIIEQEVKESFVNATEQEVATEQEMSEKQEVATVESVKQALATKSLLGSYLNENNEYIAKATDKDGKSVTVVIKGENAYNSSALNVIADFESMSDKMKAYHIAELSEKEIKLKGFKTKSDYVSKQVKKLSPSQVSKLNRVGRIFLSHSIKNEDGSPVYEYRDGIPALASITNLQECLSLLTDGTLEKLDFTACDKFSEKECDAIVYRFVNAYIKTELLHPEASCKDFRAELNAIRKTENGTGNGAGNDAGNDAGNNTSSDDEMTMTDKQYCISALDSLVRHIVQDEEILEKIGEIVEFVNAHMSDEQEAAEQEQEQEQEQEAGEQES